jgi:hypothetical protein
MRIRRLSLASSTLAPLAAGLVLASGWCAAQGQDPTSNQRPPTTTQGTTQSTTQGTTQSTTTEQQAHDPRCDRLSADRRTDCERQARERAHRRASSATGGSGNGKPMGSEGSSTSREAGSMNHPGTSSPRASTQSSRPDTAVSSGDKDTQVALPEAKRPAASEDETKTQAQRKTARQADRAAERTNPPD